MSKIKTASPFIIINRGDNLNAEKGEGNLLEDMGKGKGRGDWRRV
jgi:hypothetical protein